MIAAEIHVYTGGMPRYASAKELPVLSSTNAACCPPAAPLPPVPEPVARVLKALADETRLALFVRIASSPSAVCVCDLVEGVPVGQPTVSHHLKVLREAGLVTAERRGVWAYYEPAPSLPAIARAILDAILAE